MASFIFAEKVLRQGALARAVSVLLVVAGVAQVLSPYALPSLA